MTHFHNNSIIGKQTVQKEKLSLTYRLFENGMDGVHVYSALITMRNEVQEQDFYIPDLASEKDTALHIFRAMHKNFVLPEETETLFSEGAFEIEKTYG